MQFHIPKNLKMKASSSILISLRAAYPAAPQTCFGKKTRRGCTQANLNKLMSWRSGYCYLNKGECNFNQSKDDSFVERVAVNNS